MLRFVHEAQFMDASTRALLTVAYAKSEDRTTPLQTPR